MATPKALAVAPQNGPAAIATRPADQSDQMMTLLDRAVAMGKDGVEVLEKLLELRDRENRRTAELEFSRALAAFQRDVPAVPKSSKAKIPTKGGGSFEYAYADLEQIIETVRPHLSAHGLSFTFDTEMSDQMLVVQCVLRHELGHFAMTTFTLPTASESSVMSAQQKVGAALTFAKRHSLVAALGLALTDPEPAEAQQRTASTITEDQAATLDQLIVETKTDRAKLLAAYRVAALSELRPNQFVEAVRVLEARRKEAGQ